jgi:[acyl-carrier-protein] S-malonyltransferase
VPLAFVFPGQGSHRAGALSAWLEHPAARVLDEVGAGLGRDVVALSEDPSAGARTADAQPAIMAASLVAWQALTDAGVRADLVAGHSLGECTAAIASGALSVRDGARLVAARGNAMGEACAANPGTMAAVVKLGPDAVSVLLDGIDGLVIANDNAPGQVVVAGTSEAVAAVRERARDAGGRALPLDVEGAFHSPAMAPAVAPVTALFASLEVTDPTVPLVTGTTVRDLRTGPEVAAAIVAGILSPVRWREVQVRLAELGITQLVEVGPGGVLAGLAKRTIPDVEVHTVGAPDELAGVLAALDLSTTTGEDRP